RFQTPKLSRDARRASLFLCMGFQCFTGVHPFSYVKEFQCFPSVRPFPLYRSFNVSPVCVLFFCEGVSFFPRGGAFFFVVWCVFLLWWVLLFCCLGAVF